MDESESGKRRLPDVADDGKGLDRTSNCFTVGA